MCGGRANPGDTRRCTAAPRFSEDRGSSWEQSLIRTYNRCRPPKGRHLLVGVCVAALPSDESLDTSSINRAGCRSRKTVWPLTHRIIDDIYNGVVVERLHHYTGCDGLDVRWPGHRRGCQEEIRPEPDALARRGPASVQCGRGRKTAGLDASISVPAADIWMFGPGISLRSQVNMRSGGISSCRDISTKLGLGPGITR